MNVLAVRSREVLAVAALVLLGVVCLYPAALAGFVLVDDHEILSFAPQAYSDPQLPRPPGLIERIVTIDTAYGRVRPVYWVVRYAEIALVGPHPHAWHALYIALGIASSVLLYAALRDSRIGRFLATLGAAWLLVAPGVSTVWIRLGPQESIGTLFVLAAAWALVRSQSTGLAALYVLSASAATLTKENFSLVPPALLGLHLVVADRRRFRLVSLTPVLVGLAVLGVAFFTARLAGGASYGGSILNRAAGGAGWATEANLAFLARDGGVVLPVLVLGLVAELARQRAVSEAARQWLSAAVLVLVLIVPQLVVYGGGAGFAVGRYILPAGLGIAAAFAVGAHWLWTNGKPALCVTLVALWCGVLVFGALWTRYDAESFLLDWVALDKLVTSVTHTAPMGSTIGLAADPTRDVELVDSLPYQLAFYGRPDLQTTLVGQTPATCADLAGVVLFESSRPTCMAGDDEQLLVFTQVADLYTWLPDVVHRAFPGISISYSVWYPR